MTDGYHEPVMVSEVMSYLLERRREVVVDCTAGDGGHSLEVLRRTASCVVALDVDRDAVSTLKRRLDPMYKGRFLAIKGDYRNLPRVLATTGIPRIDASLFDLGVSSRQVDSPDRGFSYSGESPLDMRMNQDSQVTVKDILHQKSQDELATILWEYGEERFSRQIAKGIVKARESGSLETSQDLVEAIRGAVPASYLLGPIHPARRTFQALRIATNDELSPLGGALEAAFALTRRGGAVVVLSYHSLEDRIVKNTFRRLEDRGLAKRLTKKPLVPGDDEVQANPRARSAKLRAVERA